MKKQATKPSAKPTAKAVTKPIPNRATTAGTQALQRNWKLLISAAVGLVALLVITAAYSHKATAPASLVACTSNLAGDVNQVEYSYSGGSTPPPYGYVYHIALNCNGSVFNMEDTANKPLYHTTGKNDAASQQIIAALAMDLADRRKSEVKPDALDCTTTVGGPWASIVLTHSDTAKTKYTIDLCLFKGDERTAALVDQIKALIPDLDSIVASHHK